MAGVAIGVLSAAPAHAFKISQQYLSPNYDPNELFYAGDDRDFWTIILGNPFPAPKPVVDERVLEAMSDTRWGKRTNFTTAPNESARSAYRIIMLINGSTTSAYRICQYYPDRPFGPGSTRGEVKVVATYCRGESPLTQAIGKVDAAGPGDPEFRQFIRQMVANLLPSHNPQAREDRRRRWRR